MDSSPTTGTSQAPNPSLAVKPASPGGLIVKVRSCAPAACSGPSPGDPLEFAIYDTGRAVTRVLTTNPAPRRYADVMISQGDLIKARDLIHTLIPGTNFLSPSVIAPSVIAPSGAGQTPTVKAPPVVGSFTATGWLEGRSYVAAGADADGAYFSTNPHKNRYDALIRLRQLVQSLAGASPDYAPTAVAVVATKVPALAAVSGTVPWPAMALDGFGEALSPPPGVDIRCGIVTGAAIATVTQPAWNATSSRTFWSSGTGTFLVAVELLLPEDATCTDALQ